MSTIQSEYESLLQELNAVQAHASRLQQQISSQGKDYQAFEKLFIKGKLSGNVGACATAIGNAAQSLRQSMDSEMKKLPLMADYEAVSKQRDRLRSSGVHLTALLKKAGAKGTAPISKQLLQDDATAQIAAFNQRVQRLSQSAANPAAFRQAFTLQKKPVSTDGSVGVVMGPVKKGSIIKFGTYPQTASGNDKTPIEWLVLDIIGDKILVVSKFGLDAKPYNTECVGITWQQSTLRKWLNGEFLNKAFTPEQQRSIVQTKVSNARSECYSGWSTIGSSDTQDKIFLLSYRQANKYFDVTYQNSQNVKSRVVPTEYAQM